MENDSDYFGTLCSMVDSLKDDLPDFGLRRDVCPKCERPSVVCLCTFFPENLNISKKIKIWIFQHPKEEDRCLRTTRILEKCLSEKNFEIIKSKQFTVEKFPQLEPVYKSSNTVVLYPSEKSISINEYRSLIDAQEEQNIEDDKNQFHVIIIDGTWAQASGIYWTNEILQKLKQIKIDTDFVSAYTIRTQPREFFLSTLETVSIILSTLEKNPQIYDDLVKPLRALCNYQFEHGAQPHQSKEWLIFNNLYKKPISKKNLNKLTKNSKFLKQNSQNSDQDPTTEDIFEDDDKK